ncbi:hypothetical protein [Bacteroides sp. KG122]|uniref:hypothetical protein n=1 Tax=Bacteroides sp. KG122 TaxID=3397827 RepID=UPI003D999CAC
MEKNGILRKKRKEFAIRIIKPHRYISTEKENKSIYSDAEERMKLLTAGIKTAKSHC